VSIPLKTPEEIEAMRVSCRAAREILEEVSLAVVPGVSTGEIDKLAARLISDRGGRSPFLNYRGFPGHICISVNDEIVHGIGGARRIQYGDIVKLDIGIVLHGWVGDTATTIPVGEIPAATARLLDKTQEALALGIEQARATGSITSPRRSNISWSAMATASYANSSATAWDASCMRNRTCRTTAAKSNPSSSRA